MLRKILFFVLIFYLFGTRVIGMITGTRESDNEPLVGRNSFPFPSGRLNNYSLYDHDSMEVASFKALLEYLIFLEKSPSENADVIASTKEQIGRLKDRLVENVVQPSEIKNDLKSSIYTAFLFGAFRGKPPVGLVKKDLPELALCYVFMVVGLEEIGRCCIKKGGRSLWKGWKYLSRNIGLKNNLSCRDIRAIILNLEHVEQLLRLLKSGSDSAFSNARALKMRKDCPEEMFSNFLPAALPIGSIQQQEASFTKPFVVDALSRMFQRLETLLLAQQKRIKKSRANSVYALHLQIVDLVCALKSLVESCCSTFDLLQDDNFKSLQLGCAACKKFCEQLRLGLGKDKDKNKKNVSNLGYQGWGSPVGGRLGGELDDSGFGVGW